MRLKKACSTWPLPAIIVLVVACGGQGSSDDVGDEVRIMAAASLRQVVSELSDSYKVADDVAFSMNFASSGTLARQIEYGAEADIFLSANPKWAHYIQQKGMTVGDPKVIAGNLLVIIARQDLQLDTLLFDDHLGDLLQSVSRMAMGDPDHVPAGMYSREALKSLGIYDSIKSKIIHTKDVRSTLRLVQLGEVDIGLVYRTDAILTEEVKILALVPQQYYAPVKYIGVLLSDRTSARQFFNFMSTKDASVTWKKYGFINGTETGTDTYFGGVDVEDAGE